MTIETTTTNEASQSNPQESDRSPAESGDPRLAEVIESRNKAKREAKELRTQFQTMQAELAELKSFREEKEQSEAMAANDFAKVRETLEKKLKDKDAAMQQLQAQIAERDKKERKSALLDGLHKKFGGERDVIAGLYLQAVDQGKLSLPDQLDDAALDETAAVLWKQYGHILKPNQSSNAPVQSGQQNAPTSSNGVMTAEAVAALAQRMGTQTSFRKE